jgi:serine/threonine-protein kinase
MKEKITIEIIKGEGAGQKFEYEDAERIFVGRQADCGIVLPEKTVSRYHCLLDINPPTVKLQDFGSLNGTFLNDVKIGQRERDKSWEEASRDAHKEYELHDGDVIGIGKKCRLKCTVEEPDIMAISGAWDGTMPEADEDEENPAAYDEIDLMGNEGAAEESEAVPEGPIETAEKERSEAADWPEEAEEKIGKEQGADSEAEPEEAPEEEPEQNNPKHDEEMDKILGELLMAILGGKQERPVGPSPVEGFDKIALLGKGGMGEVWKVRENKTGKLYALKTMLPQIAGDKKARDMFLREAKLTEFLDHENVVRTYKTGFSNNVYYILMDICEGGSVDDLMKRYGGKLSLNLATFIILQALEGLEYVHNVPVQAEIVKRGLFGGRREKLMDAKGLVHRDFKPGNIFLMDKSDHPVAKVADFGMAKAFQAAGFSTMSSEGMVKGTVPFMPRQQALDCRFAKPEVDVWAAAASYYYMLTGQFPKNFRQGVNMWQILVTESATPIRQRDPSVPERLAQVIDRALVERPVIGCNSAAALRYDIIRALPEGTRNYCMDIIN